MFMMTLRGHGCHRGFTRTETEDRSAQVLWSSRPAISLSYSYSDSNGDSDLIPDPLYTPPHRHERQPLVTL